MAKTLTVQFESETASSNSPTFQTWVGATGRQIRVTPKESGFSFFGKTFLLWAKFGDEWKIAGATMTLETDTLAYYPQASEIDEAGDYTAWVTWTDASDRLDATGRFTLSVGQLETDAGDLAWTNLNLMSYQDQGMEVVALCIQLTLTNPTDATRMDMRVRPNADGWNDNDVEFRMMFTRSTWIEDVYGNFTAYFSIPEAWFRDPYNATTWAVDIVAAVLEDGTTITAQEVGVAIDPTDVPSNGNWIEINYQPDDLGGTVVAGAPPTPPEYPNPTES
jgi:hypothetical protein